MIKLHGSKGAEIWVKSEMIVAMVKDCQEGDKTRIIVDALCKTPAGVVNESFSVLELPDEIDGLIKKAIMQEDIDEKYCDEFEHAKGKERAEHVDREMNSF